MSTQHNPVDVGRAICDTLAKVGLSLNDEQRPVLVASVAIWIDQLQGIQWQPISTMPTDEPVLCWYLGWKGDKLKDGQPAMCIKKANGDICHWPEDHFEPPYPVLWCRVNTPTGKAGGRA